MMKSDNPYTPGTTALESLRTLPIESLRTPLLALLAVAAPLLIGGSLSPSSTFFNQVCAVFGWGLLLAARGIAHGPMATQYRPWAQHASLICLLAALAVLAPGMLASGAPVGQRFSRRDRAG